MYPLTLIWIRRGSRVRQTSLGLFQGTFISVVGREVPRALVKMCGRVESGSVILEFWFQIKYYFNLLTISRCLTYLLSLKG